MPKGIPLSGTRQKGAGRKPSPDKRQSITIRLNPATIALLKTISNKTELIESLIIKYFKEIEK